LKSHPARPSGCTHTGCVKKNRNKAARDAKLNHSKR
jgi:hypothetical protein